MNRKKKRYGGIRYFDVLSSLGLYLLFWNKQMGKYISAFTRTCSGHMSPRSSGWDSNGWGWFKCMDWAGTQIDFDFSNPIS